MYTNNNPVRRMRGKPVGACSVCFFSFFIASIMHNYNNPGPSLGIFFCIECLKRVSGLPALSGGNSHVHRDRNWHLDRTTSRGNQRQAIGSNTGLVVVDKISFCLKHQLLIPKEIEQFCRGDSFFLYGERVLARSGHLSAGTVLCFKPHAYSSGNWVKSRIFWSC